MWKFYTLFAWKHWLYTCFNQFLVCAPCGSYTKWKEISNVFSLISVAWVQYCIVQNYFILSQNDIADMRRVHTLRKGKGLIILYTWLFIFMFLEHVWDSSFPVVIRFLTACCAIFLCVFWPFILWHTSTTPNTRRKQEDNGRDSIAISTVYIGHIDKHIIDQAGSTAFETEAIEDEYFLFAGQHRLVLPNFSVV